MNTSVASYLVLDSLTKRRSDAALIRISVPFEDDADGGRAHAHDFLHVAYPALTALSSHMTCCLPCDQRARPDG